MISCTTTVCVHVAVLPQSSVASQVRVVLYVPKQLPGVVASVKVRLTLTSHRSDTVGGGKTGVAGQLMGDTAGTQVMTGGVLSCTVIALVQVDVLPQSSVASQVRNTIYSCGHVPG